MAEKGIIISQQEMPSMLARRKFRKMLPIKPQPEWKERDGLRAAGWSWFGKDCGYSSYTTEAFMKVMPENARYAVGDDLYVKETYKGYWKEQTSLPCNCDYYVEYRADSSKRITRTSYLDRYENDPTHKWKPSIYMPKIFARIWMPCTKVTVQRPQELSARDMWAEGLEFGTGAVFQGELQWKNLYISIYGKEAWLKNLLHFVYHWQEIEIKGEK